MTWTTVQDVSDLFRPLTVQEQSRAEKLIPLVESSLRLEARNVGIDLDREMTGNEDLALVFKSVTVDVVARTLMTSTNQEPMTQMSQTAGPYTASGTFLVPGGGLFIKKSELARLGLRRQRMVVMEIYGNVSGPDHCPP